METKTQILIVNYNRLLGDVVSAVLACEPDMVVIGSCSTVEKTLELAPKADVILVNTHMEGDTALKIVRAIANAKVHAKILVLGMVETREQVLPYVQAGASGYVLKDDSTCGLMKRIREICAGKTHVSPHIASALIAQLAEYNRLMKRPRISLMNFAKLSPREKEIMEWVGKGLTNQQIAKRLVIEVGTVKNHVHNILHKLGANNRRDISNRMV